MKFFHLSDLHIGLRLYNRDLKEDQTFVFDQIIRAAGQEQPDAVVIAGDVYDKAIPSAEAVSLFDRFLSGLHQAIPQGEIMVISGNHDSGPRVNLYRGVLQRQHIHMIGLPPQAPEEMIQQVTLADKFGPVHFYLLPFVRPSMVSAVVGGSEESSLSYDEALHRLIQREAIDTSVRNVLVSHQFYLPPGGDAASVARMDSETVTVGNIDAVSGDFLELFDYAALGHIHKPMSVGDSRFRYCGTPLACSVSEAGQEKAVLVVELEEKGSCRIRSLPLVPLRQVRILTGTQEAVLEQACNDYVSVVLTDPIDFDVFDVQDRLRAAFPNLLEVRRNVLPGADYRAAVPAAGPMDPFDLCSAFLGGVDDGEAALLREVINAAREVTS